MAAGGGGGPGEAQAAGGLGREVIFLWMSGVCDEESRRLAAWGEGEDSRRRSGHSMVKETTSPRCRASYRLSSPATDCEFTAHVRRSTSYFTRFERASVYRDALR